MIRPLESFPAVAHAVLRPAMPLRSRRAARRRGRSDRVPTPRCLSDLGCQKGDRRRPLYTDGHRRNNGVGNSLLVRTPPPGARGGPPARVQPRNHLQGDRRRPTRRSSPKELASGYLACQRRRSEASTAIPACAESASALRSVGLPVFDEVRPGRIIERDGLPAGRWIAPNRCSALAARDQVVIREEIGLRGHDR